MLDHRADLITDLGGESAVSAQQRGAIEMAVRTRLLIDHAAAYLLEQKSLINGRKRGFIPLVRELQSLVDSYVRILTTLGLERRVKPALSLDSYLTSRYGESPLDADATHTPT